MHASITSIATTRRTPLRTVDVVDRRAEQTEADDEQRHADERQDAEGEGGAHASEEHTYPNRDPAQRSQRLEGDHDALAMSRRRNAKVAAARITDAYSMTVTSATTGPRRNVTLPG